MLLDYMSEETSELSEKEINLWEDLMGIIRTLEFDVVELNPSVILFETSIRSYLLEQGVPAYLVYPIMRYNNYSNNGQIVSGDEEIRIPSISQLDKLFDEIRNKV